MTSMELPWKRLVDRVRDGELEPLGEEGIPEYMFCDARNVFISDPVLVQAIQRARSHREPFMFIGPIGTGKNVFLELVAKGDAEGNSSVPFRDENVTRDTDEVLEKFFGPEGRVVNYPNALMYFDMLENAVSWDPFIDRMVDLVLKKEWQRTDGKYVKSSGIRVVGGALCELEPLLPESGELFKYLYRHLSQIQLVRSRRLSERRDVIDQLLAETIAGQVLNPKSSIDEQDAREIGRISSETLERLQEYPWSYNQNLWMTE